MQRITRDRLTVVFDRRIPPVAHVKPGETFIVETEDAILVCHRDAAEHVKQLQPHLPDRVR